jgi:hypothetical protein
MDPLPVEALLADASPPMRDIAEWLRAVVRRAVPVAVERVRAGWRIIGYDLPVGPRRTAYFAWIMVEGVHVHLGFPQGVLMQDPAGNLAGAGVTKKARWVTLTPDSMLTEAELAGLIREALRIAALPAGERAALAEASRVAPID